MPFIHLSLTQKLAPEKKADLANEIAKLVSQIPGKPYEKTMVRIDDGCDIYRGGKPAECAFMETCMKKPSDFALQVAYIEGLYKLFDEKLGLTTPQCYFCIIETDHWGSRGTLH